MCVCVCERERERGNGVSGLKVCVYGWITGKMALIGFVLKFKVIAKILHISAEHVLLPPSPWRPLDEEEMLYLGVGEQVQDAGHMTEHLSDTLNALDLKTIRTAA